MRLAFAGTPAFAAVALEQLLAAGHTVPCVLTQPDRPAGRGMKLQASAVKEIALARGLPVFQPRGLRLDGRYGDDAAAAQSALQAADLDAMVVAAYGLILPAWVLTLPRRGCLNIHASLLPRWRGAAPIQRAIEAGDAETGITIMQMDEGLDTGAMLSVRREPIRAGDSASTLHDRLATLGGRLIVDALQAAERGGLHAQPQPEAGVSYAHKLGKAEAAIDWRASAAEIERRVRAFDPFPGATFTCGDEVVKLWRAEVVEGDGSSPGTVQRCDDRLRVACGGGMLELLQLQRPGGRRISAREFLAGRTALPDCLSSPPIA